MKTLRSIVREGLLDPDFEEQVDRQVMPKLAEYIISAWSKIHFKLGSTHEYDKCWVNAGDFEDFTSYRHGAGSQLKKLYYHERYCNIFTGMW